MGPAVGSWRCEPGCTLVGDHPPHTAFHVTPLLASFLLVAAPEAEASPAEADAEVVAKDGTEDGDFGPFFEAEPPSDTSFRGVGRKGKAPVLSFGDGAFCFVDGSHCKASLLADATVAAGMRVPASNKGPDMPYAHYGFRGGLVVRPLMFRRKAWHPWGVGIVGSWTMGTGAVVVESSSEGIEQESTERTPATRIGVVNQVWLGKRPHAMHIDVTFGGVKSPVLTSGHALWATHAEIAFGWGGWGSVYASGDFLDRDTRIGFGVRAHGLASGPLIALAILGAALGGAL